MVRKRARNDKGHFIADDPNTPENEAWVSNNKTQEDIAEWLKDYWPWILFLSFVVIIIIAMLPND